MSTVSTRKGAVHANTKATLRVSAEGGVEIKQLHGRDHLVFPAIILTEGVLWSSNAEHPALALSEEFGIFPSGWDGRPVFYGHPKIDDVAVSGNLPELWDNGTVIGQLFSSDMASSKKLRTQVWLDKEKTPQEVLDALEAGSEMEVSTGLWTLEEDKSGRYDGEKYSVIWRNIMPDHLAILPQGTKGACSIEDGCGAPRTNQAKVKGSEMTTTPAIVSPPNPAVATPAPVIAPTPAAAPAPTANCGGGCQASPEVLANADKAAEKKFIGNFRKKAKSVYDGLLASMGFKLNELSDMDVRNALQCAVDAYTENSEYYYCYILAVFPSKVVMTCMDKEYKWHNLQVSYSVAEGGAVSLGTDYVEVRPETQYVPVVVND